jgi:hypothetical protein
VCTSGVVCLQTGDKIEITPNVTLFSCVVLLFQLCCAFVWPQIVGVGLFGLVDKRWVRLLNTQAAVKKEHRVCNHAHVPQVESQERWHLWREKTIWRHLHRVTGFGLLRQQGDVGWRERFQPAALG